MKRPRLTVIQHHVAEGPGRIRAWADSRNVGLDVVARYAFEALPRPSDGVIVLGGPQSAVFPTGPLAEELAWLQDIVRRDPTLPVLGICLGAQLLAKALGGDVRPAKEPEVGWTPVHLVDPFEAEGSLDVLQWHEDGFSIPPGATLIASGRAHLQQGFRHGNRVGLQFHPEWDEPTLDAMRRHDPEMPLPMREAAARQLRVECWFAKFLDAWLLLNADAGVCELPG